MIIYTYIVIAVFLVIAYLLGSIPSAVWIGKHYYGIDVREHGSRNAGTTNTLRVLGLRAAIPVFVVDILKGFVAVTIMGLVKYDPAIRENINTLDLLKIFAVVCAVVGHIFPIFANFKGGKGVATVVGAVAGIYAQPVLLCFAVWCLVLALTHYVSLASILGGLAFPIIIVISPTTNNSIVTIVFSILVAIMLVVTHRNNIKRLLNGSESKTHIFDKKASNPEWENLEKDVKKENKQNK